MPVAHLPWVRVSSNDLKQRAKREMLISAKERVGRGSMTSIQRLSIPRKNCWRLLHWGPKLNQAAKNARTFQEESLCDPSHQWAARWKDWSVPVPVRYKEPRLNLGCRQLGESASRTTRQVTLTSLPRVHMLQSARECLPFCHLQRSIGARGIPSALPACAEKLKWRNA